MGFWRALYAHTANPEVLYADTLHKCVRGSAYSHMRIWYRNICPATRPRYSNDIFIHLTTHYLHVFKTSVEVGAMVSDSGSTDDSGDGDDENETVINQSDCK